MKRLIALFAALVLLAGVISAGAEEWDEYEYYSSLYYIDPIRDLVLRHDTVTRSSLGAEKGTAYAVYSAPFDDAWRAADGRAKVSAEEPFILLGTVENGAWSMIEYNVSGGAKRIGWARIPGVVPLDEIPDDARLCRLNRDARLTDDPNGKAGTALRLRRGDAVVGLGVMGRWTYVQTEVGGKIAWLFVESDALDQETLWDIDENGVLTVREGVTRIGDPTVDVIEDENGDSRCVRAPLRRDDISIPSLIPGESIPLSVRALALPSTLRTLGAECIVGGQFDHIILPNVAECARWDVFYGVTAQRIILTKDCSNVDAVLNGTYVTVGRWETEEGNPFFVSVDGVLFSADGKTLISYPNGAEAEHYTVPAGVEAIADRAFYDEDMKIPLKTVSLPIGLKRIGEYAFSGCGRLISLTVPLTVTELAENAFCDCVSLERLSLPPGLKAVFNDGWAERGDFTHYTGDNGSWVPEGGNADPGEEPEYGGSFSAYANTPDGTGTVPWYAAAYDALPAGETPAGAEILLIRTENGRALCHDWEWTDEGYSYTPRWYDMDCLLTVTGDAFFSWSYVDDWHTRRERTGDSRVLGVLRADTPETPVRFFDAPGGRETAHLYPGEQAEVLEKRDGWLRVRTVRLEGWIAGENFTEIRQAGD